ncbi:hypothetical protein L2E82_50952 [Cichorium intybus]|nr:hypothetical protein L2E82_50952 [Cichorium intybus]
MKGELRKWRSLKFPVESMEMKRLKETRGEIDARLESGSSTEEDSRLELTCPVKLRNWRGLNFWISNKNQELIGLSTETRTHAFFTLKNNPSALWAVVIRGLHNIQPSESCIRAAAGFSGTRKNIVGCKKELGRSNIEFSEVIRGPTDDMLFDSVFVRNGEFLVSLLRSRIERASHIVCDGHFLCEMFLSVPRGVAVVLLVKTLAIIFCCLAPSRIGFGIISWIGAVLGRKNFVSISELLNFVLSDCSDHIYNRVNVETNVAAFDVEALLGRIKLDDENDVEHINAEKSVEGGDGGVVVETLKEHDPFRLGLELGYRWVFSVHTNSSRLNKT